MKTQEELFDHIKRPEKFSELLLSLTVHRKPANI